jgi:anhydro-N-acetylmuramic acid kinase
MRMRVIGLMSGTSYDAIDAAAADLRLVGDSLSYCGRSGW